MSDIEAEVKGSKEDEHPSSDESSASIIFLGSQPSVSSYHILPGYKEDEKQPSSDESTSSIVFLGTGSSTSVLEFTPSVSSHHGPVLEIYLSDESSSSIQIIDDESSITESVNDLPDDELSRPKRPFDPYASCLSAHEAMMFSSDWVSGEVPSPCSSHSIGSSQSSSADNGHPDPSGIKRGLEDSSTWISSKKIKKIEDSQHGGHSDDSGSSSLG